MSLVFLSLIILAFILLVFITNRKIKNTKHRNVLIGLYIVAFILPAIYILGWEYFLS